MIIEIQKMDMFWGMRGEDGSVTGIEGRGGQEVARACGLLLSQTFGLLTAQFGRFTYIGKLRCASAVDHQAIGGASTR